MLFSKEIKDSPTLKLAEIAREKIRRGEKVISLSVGQPDFLVPEYIKDGINEALRDNYTGYSDSKGLVELREAISKDNNSRYNSNYNIDNILVLPGAKNALFLTLAALLEPNDEVIIISPYYVSYPPMIKLAEVESKIIDIPLNENFSLPIDKIKSSINNDTKVLILNYPNNPTGMLMTKEEVNEILEIIKEHNIYLLSDEIYDKLVFSDNNKFISFSTYKEIEDKLIVVNGYSKTYAMTGFRIGYALANKDLINKMNLINQNINTNTNTFVQRACIKIYENDESHLDDYMIKLKERANYVHEEINKLSLFSGMKPEGGFYYFINISNTNMTSTEFSNYLIDNYNLVTTPGIAFGEHFDHYIRISLAVDISVLKEAIDIFSKINLK